MVKNRQSLECFVPTSVSIKPTQDGILNGKTFVVKDLVSIAGHVSSFGHPRWRETHKASTETAPLVSKLLNAGAEMVGLTKLDQFAWSAVGSVGEGIRPLNSLYPDRFTGGSSSGSASAVAGKIADIGIGTDTGGSIRVPSAGCGLFGIRPTYARIDSSGVIPLASSFDTVGIMTRSLPLLLSTFNVMCKEQSKLKTPIKRVLIPNDSLALVEAEVKDTLLSAISKISALIGAKTEDIEFDSFTNDTIVDLYQRIQARDIWKVHGDWFTKNMDCLAPDVKKRAERADLLSKSDEKEKKADNEKRAEYTANLIDLVTPDSVIAMPIISGLTARREASTDEVIKFRLGILHFAAPASFTGCPEVVVPIKNIATSMTYGLGFLGARNQDEAIMKSLITAVNTKDKFEVK